MSARAAVCAAMYGLPDTVTIDGERYKINTDYRTWARIEKLFVGDFREGGAAREGRLAAALALAYPRLPQNAQAALWGLAWFYSGGRLTEDEDDRRRAAVGAAAGDAAAGDAKECGGCANTNGEPSEKSDTAANGAPTKAETAAKVAAYANASGEPAENGAPASAPAPAAATAAAEQNRRAGRRAAPPYDIDEDFEYIWGAFLSEYGIDLAECNMHWWRFRALLMSLGEDCRFSKIVAYRSMDTSKIENKEVRRHYESVKRRFSLPDRRTAEERERDTAECLGIFF